MGNIDCIFIILLFIITVFIFIFSSLFSFSCLLSLFYFIFSFVFSCLELFTDVIQLLLLLLFLFILLYFYLILFIASLFIFIYFPPSSFQPGWFIVVDLKEIPQHLYKDHLATHSPLVLFGVLPHEQKISVVNLVIKSHAQGHFRPIKSKERLIFHLGYRRFANCPVFSEHTSGNKHKVRLLMKCDNVVLC